MNEIEFSALKNFSKIFIDFIANKNVVMDRFKNLTNAYSEWETLQDYKDNNSRTMYIAVCLKPAFLGGTISNFLKIHSAINLAKKLKNDFQNINFIPLVIVEDDNIDNLESSQVAIFNDKLNIKRFSCIKNLHKEDRSNLSERLFDRFTTLVIYTIDEMLPEGSGKSDLLSIMQNVYTMCKPWSDAYIEFCTQILSKYKPYFIKASQLRKECKFANLVNKELNNPGESYSIVVNAKSLLNRYGYQINEKVSNINLKYHKNNMLFKIEKMHIHDMYKIGRAIYSFSDIQNIASKKPDNFSPAVILKHIFYTNILPIAAFIVSSSELGYLSLTKELFKNFNTFIPVIVPRHSATFLVNKIITHLNKMHRDNIIFNYIFPEGSLQERIISPVYFLSLIGIEKFNLLCESIVKKKYDRHYIVSID